MNCRDVDRLLVNETFEAALSAVAKEHLRTCFECRALVMAVQTSNQTVEVSPAVLRSIQSRIVGDLRPVRPVAHPLVAFTALLVIFFGLLSAAYYRLGASGIAALNSLQAFGMLAGLTAAATLLAWSLAQQRVPGGYHRMSPRVLPPGILIALAVAIAGLFPFQATPHFRDTAWTCLKVGITQGITAGIPLFLVLRRGMILFPATTGTACGLLAGLVGTTVLELTCSNVQAGHILIAHLGVGVLGAACGMCTGMVAGARNWHLDAK